LKKELEGINNILRVHDNVIDTLDSDFEKLTDYVARNERNNDRELNRLSERLLNLENRLNFLAGGTTASEGSLNEVKRRVRELLENTESKKTLMSLSTGYSEALRVVMSILDEY